MGTKTNKVKKMNNVFIQTGERFTVDAKAGDKIATLHNDGSATVFEVIEMAADKFHIVAKSVRSGLTIEIDPRLSTLRRTFRAA